MANEKRLNRDIGLKPRSVGNLPPEKLAQILGSIYTEKTVAELMEKLCDNGGGKENDL